MSEMGSVFDFGSDGDTYEDDDYDDSNESLDWMDFEVDASPFNDMSASFFVNALSTGVRRVSVRSQGSESTEFSFHEGEHKPLQSPQNPNDSGSFTRMDFVPRKPECSFNSPQSLVDMCCKVAARSYPYEHLDCQNPPMPEDILLKILRFQFPDSISELESVMRVIAKPLPCSVHQIEVTLIEQVGCVLYAEIKSSRGSKLKVNLMGDRGAVTKAFCSVCQKGYCVHVQAALLKLISEPNSVKRHVPISDSLNNLSREQLQFVVQKVLNNCKYSNLLLMTQRAVTESTEKTQLLGAHDYSAGASIGSKALWYFSEEKFAKNVDIYFSSPFRNFGFPLNNLSDPVHVDNGNPELHFLSADCHVFASFEKKLTSRLSRQKVIEKSTDQNVIEKSTDQNVLYFDLFGGMLSLMREGASTCVELIDILTKQLAKTASNQQIYPHHLFRNQRVTNIKIKPSLAPHDLENNAVDQVLLLASCFCVSAHFDNATKKEVSSTLKSNLSDLSKLFLYSQESCEWDGLDYPFVIADLDVIGNDLLKLNGDNSFCFASTPETKFTLGQLIFACRAQCEVDSKCDPIFPKIVACLDDNLSDLRSKASLKDVVFDDFWALGYIISKIPDGELKLTMTMISIREFLNMAHPTQNDLSWLQIVLNCVSREQAAFLHPDDEPLSESLFQILFSFRSPSDLCSDSNELLSPFNQYCLSKLPVSEIETVFVNFATMLILASIRCCQETGESASLYNSVLRCSELLACAFKKLPKTDLRREFQEDGVRMKEEDQAVFIEADVMQMVATTLSNCSRSFFSSPTEFNRTVLLLSLESLKHSLPHRAKIERNNQEISETMQFSLSSLLDFLLRSNWDGFDSPLSTFSSLISSSVAPVRIFTLKEVVNVVESCCLDDKRWLLNYGASSFLHHVHARSPTKLCENLLLPFAKDLIQSCHFVLKQDSLWTLKDLNSFRGSYKTNRALMLRFIACKFSDLDFISFCLFSIEISNNYLQEFAAEVKGEAASSEIKLFNAAIEVLTMVVDHQNGKPVYDDPIIPNNGASCSLYYHKNRCFIILTSNVVACLAREYEKRRADRRIDLFDSHFNLGNNQDIKLFFDKCKQLRGAFFIAFHQAVYSVWLDSKMGSVCKTPFKKFPKEAAISCVQQNYFLSTLAKHSSFLLSFLHNQNSNKQPSVY